MSDGATSGRTPAIPLYKFCLRKRSERFKLHSYQVLTLVLTYFAYVSFHAAKRPMSVVKGVLNPNCTIAEVNNTCNAWVPFSNPEISKDYFGLLDFSFLLAYALSMFVSGYIAEHTNLRIYLSTGMFLTGIFTVLFGMGYYWKIHTLYYFFLVQAISGVTQSTGWPCVVESVGMWFPAGRRGLIMGLWNTHVSIGNIVGGAIAAKFLEYNWGMSFIAPGGLIAFFSILIFLFLVPDPRHVHMADQLRPINVGEEDISTDGTDVMNDHPVGLWKALKIPGVIEYSLCLFFAKLVSYTFLFWLPYYIGKISIEGKVYTQEEAADWAILFDVGGGMGGIVAGAACDFTKRPGVVNVVMLVASAPFLFLLRFHGDSSLKLFIMYLVISGFFVNGPYALITTAVSASLGSHPCLLGNSKGMAVVTSIIDATGSLGAALGPLFAGIISSKTNSWSDVFYMLIFADLCAALFLTRQFFFEIRLTCSTMRDRILRAESKSVNATTPLLIESS